MSDEKMKPGHRINVGSPSGFVEVNVAAPTEAGLQEALDRLWELGIRPASMDALMRWYANPTNQLLRYLGQETRDPLVDVDASVERFSKAYESLQRRFRPHWDLYEADARAQALEALQREAMKAAVSTILRVIFLGDRLARELIDLEKSKSASPQTGT